MIRLASDTNEPTTENQIVVLALILDVFAFVLLGVTYRCHFVAGSSKVIAVCLGRSG